MSSPGFCSATVSIDEPVTSSHSKSTWIRPAIGEILRRFGGDYLAKYGRRMSSDQRQVMWLLQRCRTGDLGGVLYRCNACRQYHAMPQSCGNRHCPQCQGGRAKEWFEKQKAKLLPCVYFLFTFTVPKQLRRFIRSHPRECYQAMFDASSQTLSELASHPRFVGSSRIGMTGVLHTWGRDLTYHPHTHFIVAGGAISDDGQRWLPSRPNFFVPVKAASKLFRAKFRQRMHELGLLHQIDPRAWQQPWVVHSKAVGDGRSALRYLAPYVYRVAISNRRILKCGPGPDGAGEVTFAYRKSGTRFEQTMTVSAGEFIRRFLQHVLPSGFQKVRHYGFMHPLCGVDMEWLKMLVTVTLHPVYVLIVTPPIPIPEKPCPVCPHCRGPLTSIGFILPRDWPYPTHFRPWINSG